jgi:anthranilate phosphoribosyltransferase
MALKKALHKLVNFEDLSSEQMSAAMREIMSGQATPSQIAGFLIALEMKKPTIGEVAVAVSVMREFATKLHLHRSPLVDIVGTGGDQSNTFNISTTAAFVVAAAGATVAKHGNRSVSSRCGSADVLEKAGVNLTLAPEEVKKIIDAIGIGFLFAPTYHSATKHAVIPRKELGIRTFFNLLGPLTNPAGADHVVIGVFDTKWLLLTAEVLSQSNCKRALVIHSKDGLDEISCADSTDVVELNDGIITRYSISPEDFNLERCPLDQLRVETVEQSLAILQAVLRNEPHPARNIVILNAGAAIYVAGLATSIHDGVIIADEMLSQKKAWEKFQQLISFSNLGKNE